MTRLERLERSSLKDYTLHHADDVHWALTMLREAEQIIAGDIEQGLHDDRKEWLSKLREEA